MRAPSGRLLQERPRHWHARAMLKVFWLVLRDSAMGWLDHQAARTGAALAFYTVFSLAPVLTLSIAMAGFFFGEAAARGEVVDQIGDLIGPEGAHAVQTVLQNADRPGAGFVATVVSLVTLILGATTALAELKSGLDQIWNVPLERRQGLWYVIRTRLLSVGLILALGFLMLVSLVISAALAALARVWRGEQLLDVLLAWINFLLAFVLVAALFATIYKVLPSVRIAWRDVAIGSLVTAFLFSAGKFAIGVYIGNSGIASTYGAAGSVILVLLWVYYSAQILLFGAEFTRAYAYRLGSFAHRM
ncbi:MAG TPA: YihY/virulence factor BrkB family protein [Steroidobacteraceae bacterium]|nr:YihY/virulence factor BrkB family protein [Steroidobacteraceae bacterium]